MKPWYQSKTIWLQILMTIMSVMLFLPSQDWFAAHKDWVAGIGTGSGILTIILRIWFTDTEIGSNQR